MRENFVSKALDVNGNGLLYTFLAWRLSTRSLRFRALLLSFAIVLSNAEMDNDSFFPVHQTYEQRNFVSPMKRSRVKRTYKPHKLKTSMWKFIHPSYLVKIHAVNNN
jgi:hypothetical protein